MRWIGLVVCAALVPLCQSRIDRSLGAHRAQEEVLYVTSGDVARMLLPGFEPLLADLYWLRIVQYSGAAHTSPGSAAKSALLEPLLDLTVTLDPQFRAAYPLGAIFLAEPAPRGAGQPHAAVRLLERGLHEFPRDWYSRQLLGLVTFTHLHDPQRAAQRLLAARKLEGAPFWLEGLAGHLLAEGGERERARRVWGEIAAHADLEPVRLNALFHLHRLEAQEAADELNRLAAAFELERSRRPRNLAELQAYAGRPLQLRDAEGHAFEFDAQLGRFGIARSSPLWRPPGTGSD